MLIPHDTYIRLIIYFGVSSGKKPEIKEGRMIKAIKNYAI